jgi:biopolymer transport protein TolR
MAVKLTSSRGRSRRAPMAEINVTPMVDVMLVLLIIFMVTAPLLVAGVPVQLPQSKAGALKQDEKPLNVSLDKTGKIFVDKAEVIEAALPFIFAKTKAQAGTEEPQVYLRADKGLDYGRVMAVMGELNKAGLNKVALVTTGGASQNDNNAGAGHDAH